MAITRRQFITRSGLATAGALVGPSLFGSPWLQRAAAATIGDRYLIVLFLDGGNDGLNTIIPAPGFGGILRPAYEVARKAGGGGLRVARSARPKQPVLRSQHRRPARIPSWAGGAARPVRPGHGRRHPGLRLSPLQPLARRLALDLAARCSAQRPRHRLGRPLPGRCRLPRDRHSGGQYRRRGGGRVHPDRHQRAGVQPPAELRLSVRLRPRRRRRRRGRHAVQGRRLQRALQRRQRQWSSVHAVPRRHRCGDPAPPPARTRSAARRIPGRSSVFLRSILKATRRALSTPARRAACARSPR